MTSCGCGVAHKSCFMVGNHQAVYYYFGEGTGIIRLDNVGCTGTENNITECSHNGWANHVCDDQDDAGVVCLTGKLFMIIHLALFINSSHLILPCHQMTIH